MPFCTQCGTEVGARDAFCARCGGRQAEAKASGPLPPGQDYLGNITPRGAALACYIPIIGWIPSIVVLAAARFREDRVTRFHAFQGLYLFVAWLVVDWVVSPMFNFRGNGFSMHGFGSLIKLGLIGTWVFMLIKTSQSVFVRLPLIGDLAERSVAEQR